MWQPDPNLCADCGLFRDAHANGTKCPFGPGNYIRAARETHFYGVVNDGRDIKVEWACYVCSGVQTSFLTVPVQPSDLRTQCNWGTCGTINLLNSP